MNTSEFIVKALENEGVEIIFGIPGEENIVFLEALRQSSIRYILTADERGAAFMAAAYGRLTGKPGVVFTTLGPGALNIPNGLAFATLAGIPLVALTWQNGYRVGKKDNGFMNVNVVEVFKPLVKHQQIIFSPKHAADIIHEGFVIAKTPKFGAVHIEIPEDVSEEIVPDDIILRKPKVMIETTPDPSGIDLAVENLLPAIRPLIIVGFSAIDSVTALAVSDFAESTGIHVITTPMAQGVLPSQNSLSLFSFSSCCDDLIFSVFQKTDVVIAIGYSILEFSPRFWNSNGNKLILHINSVPAKLHQNYNPQVELIGNIRKILTLLSEKLKIHEKWQSKIYKQLREKLLEKEADNFSFPIKPQYLVSVLKKTAGDALIIHDNGMHKLWMTRFFHPDKLNQVIVDNALASMGSGIPQGIVAKLLNPQKKVLVNMGDGGILMCLGELATAVALNLSLVILVWHDGNHGMINWHQKRRGYPSFGVTVTSPDFVKLAESFGGKGFRINGAYELEIKLSEAFKFDGISIIDCPVDYSDNVRIFLKK